MGSQCPSVLLDAANCSRIPLCHSCVECLEHGECLHTCCKSWFISIGLKSGFLAKEDNSLVVSVSKLGGQYVDETNIVAAVKECPSIVAKVNVDVDGKLKSCETEMACTAANTEMPLDVSSAIKSAQRHLNGVSSLQKEDIYFLNLLLQKFSSPEVYKSISKDQKAVFQKYVTYIVDVIGNPLSGANQLLICCLTDNAFFQSQGASLWCLCYQ